MWVLFAVAWGYEVDGWTAHKAPPADVSAVADARMNALLDEAVAEVAARCPSDPVERRRALTRAVARATAARTRLGDRPWPESVGHGTYSGWLEAAPEVDRVRTGTGGVFEGISWRHSVVLAQAGTASSVYLAGVLVGTDKVDHFLATGYDYWRWSKSGRAPERAVRRGERTERTFLGWMTSKAYSYADLAANYSGMRFYAALDGMVRPDPERCLARVADFRWADWVEPSWDEVLNPTVYTEKVSAVLRDNLADDRGELCAVWRAEGMTAEGRPWVTGVGPAQRGPFGLEGLCSP